MNELFMYNPLRAFFVIIPLMLSVIPIIVTVWVLLKIHSIDVTLKEIAHKIDRLKGQE